MPEFGSNLNSSLFRIDTVKMEHRSTMKNERMIATHLVGGAKSASSDTPPEIYQHIFRINKCPLEF